MLTLKNWYLEMNWFTYELKGDVFGHYRLEDGDSITTSYIKNVYLLEKNKYVFETASGSLYHLAEEDICKEYWEETKAFMENMKIDKSENNLEKIEKKEALIEKKKINRKKALENAMSWSQKNMKNQELYLIAYGTEILKAVVKYEDSVYEIKPYVHVGMIGDSVLLRDYEHGKIDFRYYFQTDYPRYNCIKAYCWSEELKSVYIHNISDGDMFFCKEHYADEKKITCYMNEITKFERDTQWVERPELRTLDSIFEQLDFWGE